MNFDKLCFENKYYTFGNFSHMKESMGFLASPHCMFSLDSLVHSLVSVITQILWMNPIR